MLARRTFSAKIIISRITKLVVEKTVHLNIPTTWHIGILLHRFSRVEENNQHSNMAVHYNNSCCPPVAMSYYAVHKNCKPAQLPVKFAFLVTAPRPANRVTVFQLISARMNTRPRLLEHRIRNINVA